MAIYPVGGLPPLVSKRALEKHMKLPLGTLDPDLASLAINGASGAVRDACHWRLDYEEVEDYRPMGTTGHTLFLPTARLVEVTRVDVLGIEWTQFDPLDTDLPYDYSVLYEAAALKVRGFRKWPHLSGSIRIDFAHGYELAEVESGQDEPLHLGLPHGLESIILAVASRSFTNPSGYSNLKVGGISETFAGSGIPTSFIVSRSEIAQLAEYVVEPV